MTVGYELTAGLEVHVELATSSKIFCGCSAEFGGLPNTHVCPVCSGMPGTLPVLNKKVVELAIRTGLALGCEITRQNRFDRKNYFYPDLPKTYQISQLYYPICRGGGLEIETEAGRKYIRIHEIHMEEDAGKLAHDPWDECTLIDYNRCGVPLLEIVSEPDFHSADEVIAYAEKLRETLLFLGVSDCKLQEGSMRVDVNLSVSKPGQPLGTRTEMKNMNSFKMIHRAVEYEAKRQIRILEEGGTIIQETRRWDDNRDASFPMRKKEDAQDYRYFPEPDLPPVIIDDAWIESVRTSSPELAEEKRRRYINELGLPEYDAYQLTSAREYARLFEETVAICKKPKETANLIMGDLMRIMTETATLPEDLTISPSKLAALINMVTSGEVNRTAAKEIFTAIYKEDADPAEYAKAHRLRMISDTGAVESAVLAVLEQNPKSVQDYKNGKDKAFGFLVGKVMQSMGGRADPKIVNETLKKHL